MNQEERDKLAEAVCQQITPIMLSVHIGRMSKEECKVRVTEDCATICLLICEGHIILKHKEGSTINDFIARHKAKNCKEDSSPSSKRFEIEGE